MYPFTDVGTMTSATVNGLHLWSGVRYYTAVRAFGLSGLSRVVVSDGVIVDLTLPLTGIVLDGDQQTDEDAIADNTTASSHWYGFHDQQSDIFSYLWALGTSPGRDNIEAFRKVGIAHRYTARSLSLQHSVKYYASVTAVNGAGLRSTIVSSDGFVVDQTRPESNICSKSEELLRNPSFGEDSSASTCPVVLPNLSVASHGWTMNNANVQVFREAEPQYQHGCLSVYLNNGSIHQDFASKIGDRYEVIVHLAVIGECAHSSCSGQRLAKAAAAIIALPDRQHLVTLAPPFPRNPSAGESVWEKHAYSFTAVSATSRVQVKSVHSQIGVAVGKISAQRCENTSPDDLVIGDNIFTSKSDAVQLSQRYISNDVMQLEANWRIFDLESSVSEYLWAVGSVRGGTQYQPFTSAGHRTCDSTKLLRIPHSSSLFVTVVAWNGANRERVVTSKEHRVDLTAPQINSLVDGTLSIDLDYQNTTELSIRWHLIEGESSLLKCSWTAGEYSHNTSTCACQCSVQLHLYIMSRLLHL